MKSSVRTTTIILTVTHPERPFSSNVTLRSEDTAVGEVVTITSNTSWFDLCAYPEAATLIERRAEQVRVRQQFDDLLRGFPPSVRGELCKAIRHAVRQIAPQFVASECPRYPSIDAAQ